MPLISVPCDLCNSNGFKVLFTSTINHQVDPSREYSSSRYEATHSTVVQCLQCGLVRANPRDDDQTLAKIYQNLMDPIYEREEQNRKHTSRDYLRLIQNHVPFKGRLLDVGCSTGIFLEVLDGTGWELFGLEPSEWAVNVAKKRCLQAKIIQGSIEHEELPINKFDVITLWDVLEHVPSPRKTLLHLHELLKPGGWLFLNIPNIDSLIAKITGKHWPLLLREHLWYFSASTIRSFFEITGFEPVSIKPNYVRFSISNILLRLGQHAGRYKPVFEKVNNGIVNTVSLKFPMGEMNVVARKRIGTLGRI
jgi:2-polyprenyl-3-methyl-5-hydroxy-6-metoxy-1,4-benzoquinol methylase